MMKDMLGVVEADCLEPTHNKQAFNTTDVAYAKCQKHIEKCMNDYYFGVQKVRLAGTSGRRVAHPGKSKAKSKAKGGGKGGGKGGKGSAAAKGKGAGGKGGVKRKNREDSDSEDTDSDDSDDGGGNGKNKKLKQAGGGKGGGKPKADFFPRILRKLMGRKNSWPFNEPVDAEYWGVLDYYEIIKTPMDFGTVATQLDAGRVATEPSPHATFSLAFNSVYFISPRLRKKHVVYRQARGIPQSEAPISSKYHV